MTPPPVGDATIATTLIALAVAAALLEALARKSQGAASAAAWDRFHLLCSDRGLSEDEIAALQVWAQRASLPEPTQVLVDRALFDRFARDRVAEVSALEPAGSRGRAAAVEALGRLRRRLRHTPPPPPSEPLSSHDLLEGVRVTVRPDPVPTGNVPAGRFVVARVDEEGVVLRYLDDDPAERAFYDAAPSGRGCWVVFGRPGEAIFRFRTRFLARPGVELPSLVVAHGEFLVKEERRRTPRLSLRVRARVLAIDGDVGRAFEAETLDLSAGGVKLVVPAPLPRGSRLAVEIALEAGRDPVPVTVAVVGSGVREHEGMARTFLNGQFVELVAGSRARIASFVSAARKASQPGHQALPVGSPVA